MKKLGEVLEGIGLFGFVLSASGLDSGSHANMIVLVGSLAVVAIGVLIDNAYVDYREE